MTPELPKFSPTFQCPKCGGDKRGVRLERAPEVREDFQRRLRVKWPPEGELLVSSCQICSYVQVARPLDYQEQTAGTAQEQTAGTAIEPTFSIEKVAPINKKD